MEPQPIEPQPQLQLQPQRPQGPQPLSWWQATRSNAWTDLALTLPLFLAYHLGVVLFKVRNGADWLTSELIGLAEHNVLMYWGLTLAIGMGMVLLLLLLGRSQVFDRKRFMWVALEGCLYAYLMRMAAGYAVGALPLAKLVGSAWQGLVMALGAGFYEEIAFRVGLFGLGHWGIKAVFGTVPRLFITLVWAVAAAGVFAGWHYLGPLGDAWALHSFVFRAACGLWLTGIYLFRGFAPAVWTHVLYDIWAMSLQ